MVGGHTFKPFHFLGERVAVSMSNALHHENIEDYAHAYGEKGGLFPLTIGGVALLAKSAGFYAEDIYTRMSRINTARWSWPLADLLTWHVCYLLKPDQGGSPESRLPS
jgi:hypothetical protein